MKKSLKLILATCAVALIACGGPEEPPMEDAIVCGEGTRPYGSQCVVEETECADGETALEDGRCVRTDFCAEGTHINPVTGRCVADPPLRCGRNTVEDDGECVPDLVIGCGEGTVASDLTCVPWEEVCGEGTSQSPQGNCRPSDELCGEHTIFDQTRYQCVPVSSLRCGAGTKAVDEQCIPTSAYYEALAADPDLTTPGAITLGEPGERFVFVGTVEAPQNQEPSIDEYTFSGAEGQWLRISLFSTGLPDPGFKVSAENSGFTRTSDKGAGIEVVREVVIPASDDYLLSISNLSQLLGEGGPAGGADWTYVGYVERIDAPAPKVADPEGDTFSGDIRRLTENLYHFDGVASDATLSLAFSTLPLTAEGEILVFSDLDTLDAIHVITQNVSFNVPGTSFYLLFDRAYSTGNVHVNFTATATLN